MVIAVRESKVDDLTRALKAISDPTRLRILRVLTHGELRVGEIVDLLDMGQSRVSRHLKIMEEAGILTSRREGMWIYYSVAPAERFRPIVDSVIAGFNANSEDDKRAEEIIASRKSETRRFFERVAPDWDRLKERLFEAVDPDECVARLVPKCSVVVDLGCGNGGFLSLVRNKADTIIGVDNSRAMLEEAGRRFIGVEGIDLRLGEIEHLPLGDGEADCAVMSLVLHHLAQPKEAFSEVSRILRKGGTFVMADFLPHSLDSLRTAHGDRWLGFPEDRLENWIRSAGLDPVSGETYELTADISLHCIQARKS